MHSLEYLKYSPFRLTSLIYGWKNLNLIIPPLWRTSYVNKWSMERFSVLAKECDDFLLLDEKSKQSYKVKIKNIQGYDPFIR